MFSFSKTGCHNKLKELSLSYSLLLAGMDIIGLILYPNVIALSEKKAASTRI